MESQTVIPPQQTGAFTNTDHSVECAGSMEARQLYNIAKQRLLNVTHWGSLCGKGSAKFHLADKKGIEVCRPAQIDDHIKIDIPGPGPLAGEGYDWVRIETIDESKNDEEDVERIIITVRPSGNPFTESETVAHFFSSLATSHFIVRRDKHIVSAAVLGRNEIPNTSESEGVDKIRNSMIAATAIAGIAKLQWGMLVNGLLS